MSSLSRSIVTIVCLGRVNNVAMIWWIHPPTCHLWHVKCVTILHTQHIYQSNLVNVHEAGLLQQQFFYRGRLPATINTVYTVFAWMGALELMQVIWALNTAKSVRWLATSFRIVSNDLENHTEYTGLRQYHAWNLCYLSSRNVFVIAISWSFYIFSNQAYSIKIRRRWHFSLEMLVWSVRL